MAIIYNYKEHNDKFSASEYDIRFRGAGTISNDQIAYCQICAINGFPHEAVIFQKVKGRVLSDGTNEVKKWLVVDYFQPWREHKHKAIIDSKKENF